MIKKIQAEETFLEKTREYFNDLGYTQNPDRKDSVEFIKQNPDGYSGFSISFLEIGNSLKFVYHVFLRINEVEDKINAIIPDDLLNPNVDLDSRTVTSSYEQQKGINKLTHFPKIRTQHDLSNTIYEFISEIEETFFPFMQEYNNIDRINRTINIADFWETDWRKPFNLGGNFIYKRLLIAKLSEKNNFVEVFEKQSKIISDGLKGEHKSDFEIVNKGIQVLYEALEKGIHNI